jgi:tRNA U34 2-thiouridine synthase MnmA/TrmU
MNQERKIRALGLCSGGLDSILAGMILRKQGIDVVWIGFETPFFTADKAAKASRQTGIPLIRRDITGIYLDMLKNPRLGYGKNMNPCRDCHSLMFRLAGEIMDTEGYDFLFSGEVAGQRPLSQTTQALRYVEKQSGFEGRILRPLSARILPETDVEKQGLVDRSRLHGFSGRSRKPQIGLAKEMGIRDYPSPAGGCLLTDRIFSCRLRDLFERDETTDVNDLHLLKYGRHIRLNDTVKIVVGRSHAENQAIIRLNDRKRYLEVDVKGIGSPTILVPAGADRESVTMAASICVGYSKAPDGQPAVVTVNTGDSQEELTVRAIPPESLKDKFIG